MLKIFYSCLILFLFMTTAKAQLETINWYFGQYMGLRFEGDQAIPVEGGQLYTGEGCASISDQQGNLQFYTDGTTVYTREHQVMVNGTRLKGNSSSTQSAIVVPYPSQPKKYIIFTVGADDRATPTYTTNEGLNYYVVDMNLNQGMGEVIHPTNNNLLPLVSEKIAAVRHRNLKDFWVVTHFEDKFYSYLVTADGVQHQPILSIIGPQIDKRTYPVNARGYLKISPNGRTLAIAHLTNLNYDSIPFGQMTPSDDYYPTNGPYANAYPGYLGLYRFDNSNGRVTDETVLDTSGSPYGIEFSSNNENLYANVDYHTLINNVGEWSHGELMVYKNLLNNPSYTGGADPIKATKRVLNRYSVLDTPSALFTARGALQLAINKKIYYSRDYKDYLSHIANADDYSNPMFEERGVVFPYYTYNVNTRYGLPPFFSSGIFRIDCVPLGGLSTLCLGNGVQFSFYEEIGMTVQSYAWDFGNGSTSTEASPIHYYTAPGLYEIKLIVQTIEFGELEVYFVAVVNPLPVLQSATLEACDADLDGSLLFDLDSAQEQINAEEQYAYTYHLTEEEALENINPLPSLYESTVNNEIIYVRAVTETGCTGITTITLNHAQTTYHSLEPIVICIAYDQAEVLQLSNYNERIEALLGTSSVLHIQYFESIDDLEANRNSITTLRILNELKKVYAKVKLFGSLCDEVVELTFQPSEVPLFTIEDIEKCMGDRIEVSGPVHEGYTYQWIGLTGEDANQELDHASVILQNPGRYTLVVTNENGCRRAIDFTVTDYPPVLITEVKVNDNRQIIITAEGEDLMYSIDGENWQYENVFVNLSEGIYTIYVRSGRGCITIHHNVVIFKWVNFLSPNTDSYNDVWRLKGLERYTDVHVQIFNRFGKLLVDKVMSNENEVWDGKYQLKIQPSDSYWYVIKIPGHTTFTGSVLLKNKK